MATISSLGAGSGMDLEGLVKSLMSVEKRPLTQLQNQASAYNAKISSLGKLSSKLSALQTAAKDMKPNVLQSALEKFAKFEASLSKTPSGGEIGTVTAGTGAVAGTYKLDVTHLAQGQKISAGSLGGVTAGTLKITVGSTETDINITDTSAEGIRNAINQAKTGVTATVVNGTSGPTLMLSGEDGAGKAFSLSGIAGLNYNAASNTGDFTRSQAARDAAFTVDGIAASSGSNKVTDVISGVTLNLTGEGQATLSIKQDNNSNLKKALEGFVTAYNDAVSSMSSMGSYNTDSKVAGELQGNDILRNAQQTLSRLVFDTTATTDGATQRLSDIGISFKTTDGKLALDNDKFAAAIDKNPEAVANLAAAIGSAFDTGMDRITGTGGQIQASTEGLRLTVKSLESRQEALTMRLETVEKRYRAQFSALDTLMSNMNSVSSYLAQNLSRLTTS